MNGAVDGSVIQGGNLDGLGGTDVADIDVAGDVNIPPHAPTVRNTVTGTVTGAVVQAGNVHGGLTIT